MRRNATRHTIVARALASAVMAALVLAPALAYARLGGGQIGGGFSGGGGSSSGGGGLGFLVGFALGSPGGFGVVIVVIIIIIVIGALASRAKGGGGSSFTGGLGQDLSGIGDAKMAGDPYAAIKAADPGFSEDFFYGRVNEMFATLQNAWMQRNMDPVRRFLSDQQFTVLQAGVQQLVLQGRINILEGIHIVHIDPISVEREGDYDSVKLAITANAIDYTIDERTKEIVNPRELGDGKTPRQFVEHWTFIRKAGALSKPEQSVQKCPNCGAPVTDGNYVKCAYCGFMMNDATLDWVLTRIEQV